MQDEIPPTGEKSERHVLTLAPGNVRVNVKSIVSHALLAKLSHLLANQLVRTEGPASVSSAESENSPLP